MQALTRAAHSWRTPAAVAVEPLARRPAVSTVPARGALLSECVRDHIVNLQAGGTDRPDNVGCQILCRACHTKKTHAESMRADDEHPSTCEEVER